MIKRWMVALACVFVGAFAPTIARADVIDATPNSWYGIMGTSLIEKSSWSGFDQGLTVSYSVSTWQNSTSVSGSNFYPFNVEMHSDAVGGQNALLVTQNPENLTVFPEGASVYIVFPYSNVIYFHDIITVPTDPVGEAEGYEYFTVYAVGFSPLSGGVPSTWTWVETGGASVVEVPHDTCRIGISLKAGYSSSSGTFSYWMMFTPKVYVCTNGESASDVVDAVNATTTAISSNSKLIVDEVSNSAVTVTNSIGYQTETLTSTEGSDSVVSAVSDSVSLDDSLGAISQVASMGSSFFASLSDGTSDDSVSFPGISFPMNGATYVLAEAAEVSIWDYAPDGLETPCRTAVTFVLVLAWLHGVRKLYERIVNGSVEVES